MDLSGLQRLDEPLAIRLVSTDAVVLVLGPIGDIGDVSRGLAPVHVHHIGELDGGILLDELLHDRLLELRFHGFHHRMFDHLRHDVHRRLRRHEFDLLQIGQEELGDVVPDPLLQFLI